MIVASANSPRRMRRLASIGSPLAFTGRFSGLRVLAAVGFRRPSGRARITRNRCVTDSQMGKGCRARPERLNGGTIVTDLIRRRLLAVAAALACAAAVAG